MTRTRRFAFVTPNFHPRTCGVGDFSMRLGQELRRRGSEVTIFTRSPAEPHPRGPEIAVGAASGASPLVIAARLWRAIQAFAPTDLVLQYTPQMLGASRFGSPATLFLAERARRKGIKVALVAHELFLPWGRRPDLAAGAALMRAQLGLLMKLCDRVLVTMDMRVAELASITRLMRLAPPGVIRVGTNALPRARVQRPGRLRVGVFSTLASTKRFDVVLDAFQVIHAERPHAELVILGDLGPPENARARSLHDAVARHPGRERIRLTGKLDLDDVAREVAELDIYLFPMISGANTRTGTLPLALGTGLPVVATRSYETDDLFVDGQNLLFAASMSGEAFGRAALRLAGDDALAATVAHGAKTLYDRYLSWERIADQFLQQV